MNKNPQDAIGIILILILFIFTLFKINGFFYPLKWARREIENNNFVSDVGMDKLTEENLYKTSVVFPVFNTQQGSSKTEKSSIVSKLLSATGSTMFDAHRNLYLKITKDLNYEHTGWGLISETLASQDGLDSLDFAMRDYERGVNPKIGIVKGTSPEKILSTISEYQETPWDYISSLLNSSNELSISKQVSCVELFSLLSQPNSSFCLPYFHMVEMENSSQGESAEQNKESAQNENSKQSKKKKPIVELGGLAVIKNSKLYCFLDKKLSRASNWVNNGIKSTCLVLPNSYGTNSSIEVLLSHAYTKIKFIGDMPVAEFKIDVTSRVNEIGYNGKVNLNSYIEEMEIAQSKYIESEIYDLFKYIQTNGIDIINVGDKIYHQHPLKWRKIKGDWTSIFPKMELKVEVTSNINSTGIIKTTLIKGSEKKL